jgi:hypothetical protein
LHTPTCLSILVKMNINSFSKINKKGRELAAVSAVFGVFAASSIGFAGEVLTAPVEPGPEPVAMDDVPYEAGRGLLTLQGPSGMFINPTSATLPANTFTAQYCFFLPENTGDIWGHGAMASYGVTDWLELGALGSYVDLPGDNPGGVGPLARLRLTQNDGWIPQTSIGGYGVFGDDPVERYSMFAAFYNRIPIADNGFVKSLGIHTGFRQTWVTDDDRAYVYGGLEVQLPYRLYLVGEVSTTDAGSDQTPYAYGLQWRARGINISTAQILQGGAEDAGFFFGIGYGLQF